MRRTRTLKCKRYQKRSESNASSALDRGDCGDGEADAAGTTTKEQGADGGGDQSKEAVEMVDEKEDGFREKLRIRGGVGERRRNMRECMRKKGMVGGRRCKGKFCFKGYFSIFAILRGMTLDHKGENNNYH